MVEVNRNTGFGPSRESYEVGKLSNGARALLVAIICYGKTDTTSSLKGMTFPAALNVREMRQALQTYIELKAQAGITIGHDPSEANVNRWVDEIYFGALINGGESTFGGSRSFQLNRRYMNRDKEVKYRLCTLAVNVLRYNKLEIVHKNSLETYLEDINIQKSLLNNNCDL